jgi:hypothetical protein
MNNSNASAVLSVFVAITALFLFTVPVHAFEAKLSGQVN